jgi:hypothetical protein
MIDQDMPARAIVAKAKILAGDTFKTLPLSARRSRRPRLQRRRRHHALPPARQAVPASMGDSGYWEDVLAEELLDK